jgi:hypothetical protein
MSATAMGHRRSLAASVFNVYSSLILQIRRDPAQASIRAGCGDRLPLRSAAARAGEAVAGEPVDDGDKVSDALDRNPNMVSRSLIKRNGLSDERCLRPRRDADAFAASGAVGRAPWLVQSLLCQRQPSTLKRALRPASAG